MTDSGTKNPSRILCLFPFYYPILAITFCPTMEGVFPFRLEIRRRRPFHAVYRDFDHGKYILINFLITFVFLSLISTPLPLRPSPPFFFLFFLLHHTSLSFFFFHSTCFLPFLYIMPFELDLSIKVLSSPCSWPLCFSFQNKLFPFIFSFIHFFLDTFSYTYTYNL